MQFLPWILSGLGLALFLEGSPYFLFPGRMRKRLAYMSELPVSTLRWSGIIEALIGVLLVGLAVYFSA